MIWQIGVKRHRVKALKGRLKAQSVIEYSMIIACVVAALLAMQIYIKRGTEGRLRQASDGVGEQYAPTKTTADITTTLTSKLTMNSKTVHLKDKGGKLLYEDDFPVLGIETKTTIGGGGEITTRSGSEELGEFEDELF